MEFQAQMSFLLLFLHSVILIHTGSVLKIANHLTLAGSSFNLPIQLTLKLSLLYQYFTCTSWGTDIFLLSFKVGYHKILLLYLSGHPWNCTALTFGIIFFPVFRIEIWLALQILYNIFQKCLRQYATGQGKFHAKHCHTYQFLPNTTFYLSAHCNS